MKKQLFTLFVAALSVCGIANAQQSFETGFFLDNYSYGHRINPSFQNQTNVIGVFIGNIGVSTSTNLGPGQIYFPGDDGLISGFNSSVPSKIFLAGINQMNNAVEDINMNLLTVGFWNKTQKCYQTIEVNVRQYGTTSVPYEAFEFLKLGGDRMYNLSNVKFDASAYLELAYGYSRKIGDQFTVGGRVKALFGMASAKTQSNIFNVGQNGNNLLVQTQNLIYAAAPGLEIPLTEDGYYDFNKAKLNGYGIAGYGFGVDLGVTYKPIEDLTVSLAVNDLGGISWKYNKVGTNEVDKTIDNILERDAEGKSVLEVLSKEISQFAPEDATNGFESLPFVINGGVRYVMPFYKGLSAGVFGTYRNYKLPYYNVRVGATVTPTNWFSFAANYGYGTYGSTFGTAFTITGGVFNFFLGAETYLGKRMADAPIPLFGGQVAINGGITFRFGGPQKSKN